MMNEKLQSQVLAIGGFLMIMIMIFKELRIDWLVLIYLGFSMLIGFFNWIDIEKKQGGLDDE